MHETLATNDEIQFERPDGQLVALPYRIAAAGRTLALAGTPLVRQKFNQHVLILTQAGSGVIRLGLRQFMVRPGGLVWLDASQQYAHGCAPGSAAWGYLWMGIHGHGLEEVCAALRFGVEPHTSLADGGWLQDAFVAVIDRLRDPGPASSAENSAVVAQMIALLVGARGSLAESTGASDTGMAALADRLRGGLARAWCVGDLAEIAHLSPAQLHRRFRQAHGTSPMGWLRRERIHAAKGLLVGTEARIAVIAAQCGYEDPYHFSRDFARMTGQPPSAFRRSGGK